VQQLLKEYETTSDDRLSVFHYETSKKRFTRQRHAQCTRGDSVRFRSTPKQQSAASKAMEVAREVC